MIYINKRKRKKLMFLSALIHGVYAATGNHPWKYPFDAQIKCSVDSKISEPEKIKMTRQRKAEWIVLIVLLVVDICLSMTAVAVSVGCNTSENWQVGTFAFLFPEWYLGQHAYKRYMRQDPGYCSTPNEYVLAFKPSISPARKN